MLKRTLILIVFSLPALAHSAVYQCEINGQMVFADQPCAADAKRIQVKAPARIGGGSMLGKGGQTFLDQRAQQRQVEGIDRDIERLERQRARAKMNLDNALIRYQDRKSRASNNLAGATLEGSLAQEAEVMRSRFQSEIDRASREVEQLRAERRRVLRGD